MSRRERGFTLIEILVVIVIILVLAAIIFPVYSAAQEKSRQSTCMNNLKQLGTAMRLYSNDWDGFLPNARVVFGGDGNPAGNWAGVYHVGGKCDPSQGQLSRYVKNVDVYKCPDQMDEDLALITASDAKPYPLSYAMNDNLTGKMIEHMTNSTLRVGLLVHEDPKNIDDGDFCWDGTGQELPGQMHGGGTIVIYCDLHAKWLGFNDAMQELKSGYWNPDQRSDR